MSNRLSYSQINRFKFCPKSWEFHYIQKMRPLEISSALLFGSAIGKTFEWILNNKESCGMGHSLYEFFDHKWQFQEINGKLEDTKTYPYVSYFKSDTDEELLTPAELEESRGNPNLAAWYSLRAKGHLIIESFKKNFLPLVEHVYSVEEKAELINEEGDSVLQFSDTVCKIKGYNDTIVLDFKTASRPYEKDSVKESVQLSGYMHLLSDKYKTRTAGYVVFLKNIDKNRTKICQECGHDGSGKKFTTCSGNIEKNGKITRCHGAWIETIRPECKMQIIIDEIPIEMEDSVIEDMDNVNTQIKSGYYPMNLEGCHNNGYGRPCEFLDFCHKGNTSKYIKLEEKINEDYT